MKMSLWKFGTILFVLQVILVIFIFYLTDLRIVRKASFSNVSLHFPPSDYLNSDEITTKLTIVTNRGRLGNQMGTLATLYCLSRLNNRKPYLQLYTANFLKKYFKINLPVTLKLRQENKKLLYHNISTFIQSKDVTLSKNVVILRGYKYSNSPTFYDFARYEIKEQFRFVNSIEEYAESVLHQIQQTRSAETFIGIHVRRTDMVNVMKHQKSSLPSIEYFNKSIDYFLSRYPNVAFVVASDDRKWCQENLKHPNIVIAPHAPSPAHDMAVLSKCNHSIITVGSFGTWAAYLTGGETIYFKAFPPKHPYLKLYPYEYTYLPEWIGMS